MADEASSSEEPGKKQDATHAQLSWMAAAEEEVSHWRDALGLCVCEAAGLAAAAAAAAASHRADAERMICSPAYLCRSRRTT